MTKKVPAASANDPIFLIHHAMVDCILEEWLQKTHSTCSLASKYSTNVSQDHHEPDAYVVPFFPLATHRDFFDTAVNFGYTCRLPNIDVNTNPVNPNRPVNPRPPIGAAEVLVPFNWAMLTGAMGAFLFQFLIEALEVAMVDQSFRTHIEVSIVVVQPIKIFPLVIRLVLHALYIYDAFFIIVLVL